MSVYTDVSLRISALESAVGDTGTASLTHLIEFLNSYASGTTSNKFNIVWSDTDTLSGGSPVTIDLASLTNTLTNDAISSSVNAIVVMNNSTESANVIEVGGSGSEFTGWSGASTHIRKIGAGGFEAWFSPIDTHAPGGGELTLTPSPGAATISYSVFVLGRS